MADLGLYDVEFDGFTTQMQLNDDDAEAYGDRAKRVGTVETVKPVPVTSSPLADDDGDAKDEAPQEKQAPAARNKARSASSK